MKRGPVIQNSSYSQMLTNSLLPFSPGPTLSPPLQLPPTPLSLPRSWGGSGRGKGTSNPGSRAPCSPTDVFLARALQAAAVPREALAHFAWPIPSCLPLCFWL